MDRMQRQKEAVAMEKLRLLLPQMGDMVRALALAKCEWDIDKAVQMLRSFHSANLDKVNLITKVSLLAVVAAATALAAQGLQHQGGSRNCSSSSSSRLGNSVSSSRQCSSICSSSGDSWTW
jgi:hypothetical protein